VTAFTTLRSDSDRQTGTRQCAVGWSAPGGAPRGDVRLSQAIELARRIKRDHRDLVGRVIEFENQGAPEYRRPRQMIDAGTSGGGRTP
jgi:hypothetical protein